MASVKDYFADVLAEGSLLSEPPLSEADKATGNLAVLLDDTNPQAQAVLDAVDSMEQFGYPPFQLESTLRLPGLGFEALGTPSSGIIAQMVAWLKKLIAYLNDEMRNLGIVSDWIINSAENLKITTRDRPRSYSQTGGRFKITTRTANLSVRYRPITQAHDLLGHLRNLDQMVKTYYAYNPVKSLSAVTRAISGQVDLVTLQRVLADVAPSHLAVKPGFGAHPENDDWRASLHLMGGQRLVVKDRANAATVMDKLGALKVRMVPSELTPPLAPSEIEFMHFNLNVSDQCLNMVISTANTLAAVNTPAIRQARKSGLDELTRLLERLQQQAATGQNVSDVRNAALCAEYFIDWVVKPYSELYGLTCRNLRAALNVCDLNAQ